MTEVENKPDQNIVTIEIPGNDQSGLQEEILNVEMRLVEGTLPASIEFEARDEEILDEYAIEIKKRGARVFIQFGDSYFIVHSEESLKFSQFIEDKHDFYQV